MSQYQTPRNAGIRRMGSVCLILAMIVAVVPAAAPRPAVAGLPRTGYRAAVAEEVISTYSQILYPISDLKIGLWYEGVPSADVDNLRYNEIDDPAPSYDGDGTYIVTSAIKSYRAGIAAPAIPQDATNISLSLIWTVRFEVEDSFHVVWSNFGVNGTYYFGPRHNPGTAYTTYTDTWSEDPSTGLPWTPATANTVDGLGFDSNVESAVHVTQAYLRLSYEIDSSVPSIAVEKYVWDGAGWLDADTAPGPYLLPGTDPQFRFVVTNGGNVDLSNVDLMDNVYGDIALDGTLAAGASAEYLLTGTWAAGQHTNTATVSGDYDGDTYTGSDDANYFGSPPAPAIDVEKYVWDGAAWVDADTAPGPCLLPGTDPLFKFVVTNSGSVVLQSVVLTDSPPIASFYAEQGLATPCVTPTSLDPQATFTCYGSLPWANGTQTDIGTVTADYGGDTYTDSDAANYLGGWSLFLPAVLGEHTVLRRIVVADN